MRFLHEELQDWREEIERIEDDTVRSTMFFFYKEIIEQAIIAVEENDKERIAAVFRFIDTMRNRIQIICPDLLNRTTNHKNNLGFSMN